MNRLPLFLSLFACTGAATGQVWEKYVAPGLVYRAEVDTTIPRMIHAIRWTPGAKVVVAVPELGGSTVFEENVSKGRETVSQMAQRTGAIAAINADFFPFTGDPVGLMVRAGELLSLPYPKRTAFGWGPGASAAAVPIGRLTFTAEGSGAYDLPQFNEECKANSISLNSERAGIARASTASAVHAVLRVVRGDWKAGGQVQAEVEYLQSEVASLPVPPGSAVLTSTGTMMPFVASLRAGQKLRFDLKVAGFDWAKIENVVGGGPWLVRGGEIAVDAAGQGFNGDFANKRHPRTAVGRSSNGDLWWVAVDGRLGFSDGATLEEAAQVMRRLGCSEAINLDGGGSTALSVLGMPVNRASGGREREVANGVVFMGPIPQREEVELALVAPARAVAGTTTYLRVQDAAGAIIPNSEIVWNASGSGWIDQGGFLRATGEGTVFVSAWARGQVLSAGIEVSPKPPGH